MQIPVTGVPRRVAAPTTPPAPQGGGGTVVPFNAPTASSFADTLRSLTQQTPASPSVTGNTTAQTGITYTPPAAGRGTGSSAATSSSQSMAPGFGSSNVVTAPPSIVSGSSSDIAGASYNLGTTPNTTQAGGNSALSALLQGISLGGAGSLGSTSGGMTPMELMLVPLQNGTSGLATSQGVGGTGALQMPFQGQAPVTQPFGPTSYAAEPAYDGYTHFHTGMDFGVAMDTPIAAAGTGKVVAAGWDNTGFGNRVIIDHGNGVQTLYGHLDKITVQAGQTVQGGQQIGLSGTTGNSSGPHLHFGVEVNGKWVDPSPYLAGQGASPAGLSTPTLQALGGGALATPGTANTASLGGGIPLGLVLLPSSSLAGSTGTPAASSGVATSGPLTDPAISGLIGQAALASGLPSSLVAAVVQTESAGNASAVSPAGAKGLMQLMDGTAAQYGVTNPFDPAQNLSAGTQYLSSLLKKYNGNEQLAVAAYNAGPSAVDLYGGIPPYPETQQYVQKVLSLQQQYGGQG